MSLWKHYHVATTIFDALNALETAPQPALPVAGGTDLLLDLQQNHHAPLSSLVDISRIPDLNWLEIRDDGLFIGASVPVSVICESEIVLRHARAVAEGCGLIGGPQVRNAATLGGNVAHALPAADGMIGLVALDAQAIIADRDGLRSCDMLSLFRGPGVTTLNLGKEILVGFQIPLALDHQASAFKRVMRPQGVALPILNMAIWLERKGDRIANVRIAVGPAGPTPQRANKVEEFLTGVECNNVNLTTAADILRSTMRFRTSSYRASAEYRYQLSESLFIDTVSVAWERSAIERSMDGI